MPSEHEVNYYFLERSIFSIETENAKIFDHSHANWTNQNSIHSELPYLETIAIFTVWWRCCGSLTSSVCSLCGINFAGHMAFGFLRPKPFSLVHVLTVLMCLHDFAIVFHTKLLSPIQRAKFM